MTRIYPATVCDDRPMLPLSYIAAFMICVAIAGTVGWLLARSVICAG